MEMDKQSHDLTQAQLAGPAPVAHTAVQQLLIPEGLKDLAEIIDMATQFD